MNRFSKESKISFAGTIVFHGLLILIGMFSALGNKTKPPEFVELSFTEIQTAPVKEETVIQPENTLSTSSNAVTRPSKSIAAVNTSSASSKNNAIVEKPIISKSTPKINPPRYNLSIGNEPIKFPESKIEVSDSRGTSYKSDIGSSTLGTQKGNFSSNSGSDKINRETGSSSSGISSPNSGNGIGKEIKGYSISWRDGGNRNRISGNLPRYPESSNKEVQIKVKITVTYDGVVSQIVPLQKADYAFESAVTTVLKTWKFEKLKPDQSHDLQTGVITFNFKLD